MRNCFHFFSDPAHGWLRVTDDDLRDVGLSRTQFSRYSYCDGPRLYLEEDMDADLFLAAYQATTGRKPEIIEYLTLGDSLIRSYQRLAGESYSFQSACRLMADYRDQIETAA